MMGPRQVAQGALFYELSIEGFVPLDHPVRGFDRLLDLSHVRPLLAPFYSFGGRPSIDPELMIRMLLLGYCMGIRSERRLCEEVHVNLAYRWFCRALLHKSTADGSSPFPGRGHPTASVTGMPRAVKPFRTATRTWNSAA